MKTSCIVLESVKKETFCIILAIKLNYCSKPEIFRYKKLVVQVKGGNLRYFWY